MIEDDEYGEDWEDEKFDPGEDDEHRRADNRERARDMQEGLR